MLRTLIRKGALGAGVMEAADCRQTYEELKARGVEFTSPPTERFYGIEALFKDNSGNWFSMTERKEAGGEQRERSREAGRGEVHSTAIRRCTGPA